MKTFYRIAALGNRPSPQEFETVEAACDAAKEALKEFPGGVFEIYKCVAMVQYTEASTFWMDGEEPPQPYRELEEGETIEETDEFKHPAEGWRKHDTRFGSIGETFRKGVFLPHRRPL